MKFDLGKWVVKYRRAIFIVAMVLLIPSVIGYMAVRVNFDMLTYLPDSIETMQGQNTLMDEFGVGAYSFITIEDMKTSEAEELADEISQVDHVKSVINLEDFIDPAVPITLYPEIIANTFKTEDASMIIVFYDTSTSDEDTLTAVEQIRELGGEKAFVSGMSALVVDLRNIVEAEETAYVAVAVILSLIAMMILVDSYVAPILFLLSIGCAIMYNLGSNIFFGEISFITQAIAAVLQLGVTMDYSIFLWHRYMEELDNNPSADPNEVMANAINETLVSVTGSSITTVAGFLALCAMTYTMGKDLGIVMAKGVVFGVICSVTVLPVMILRCTKLLQRTRHKSIIPDLSRLSHKLTNKYFAYIVIFALLLIPALIGYRNMNVTYDFTKMMSGSANELDEEYTQFLTATDKIQEDFDIATTYIVIADADLSAKDGSAMCEEIKNVDGVKNVLGVDAVLGDSIPRDMLPDNILDMFVSDEHQMILINSEYLISTDECNDQIDAVNEIVDKYDETATVIGEGPATKDLITITDTDFKIVNIISIAMVFLIILFVLKSASLPVLLVAAIEFAIYANMGICGYTGVELPFIVPVCISTIQLGSTVDYAILFSTRYKTERIAGNSRRDAIDIAATTSIPSIIVSALGFFTATFGVAVYSNISIIETFCMLMARGAIISMLTVIFLLPSLLMAFDKIICKTTIGMRDIYKKEHKDNGSVHQAA